MNQAKVKHITDHKEELTRKNCAFLREQLNMPTQFGSWWQELPIAVKKTLCKAAKIQTYRERMTDEGVVKVARSIDWASFSGKERDRLEAMARRLKNHFELIPQRKEQAKC